MLLQFSVENFMSFKEKAILSLEPSKDKEHPENVNKKGDYKGVNVVATYPERRISLMLLHLLSS